jgi:hypothetical protein
MSVQQLNASIVPACRSFGVVRSWFYYRRQPRQPRPLHRPQLTSAIQQMLAQCPPSYGYRCIHALLARRGIHCNRKTVCRQRAKALNVGFENFRFNSWV